MSARRAPVRTSWRRSAIVGAAMIGVAGLLAACGGSGPSGASPQGGRFSRHSRDDFRVCTAISLAGGNIGRKTSPRTHDLILF